MVLHPGKTHLLIHDSIHRPGVQASIIPLAYVTAFYADETYVLIANDNKHRQLVAGYTISSAI